MKRQYGKTHINIMLGLLLLLLLTACGSKKTEEVSLAKRETFTKYYCEENSSEDSIVYMKLDINPSFILGVTATGTVISLEANNEDADDVMRNFMTDYFNGVTDGIELQYVLFDLAVATQQGGYIEDTLNVNVTLLEGNIDEEIIETACDRVTTNLAEDKGIVASFKSASENDVAIPENHNDDNAYSKEEGSEKNDSPVSEDFAETEETVEAPKSEPDNNEEFSENQEEEIINDQNRVCDLCNGGGTMICDLCNGQGTVIELEEHEVEVRNNYVCPYCGGVGILDDGLHGGKTAVCGHCGGEGKTGSMSGDFREKAFDIEIVEEEVERPCSRCGGSGTMPCPHCGGTGIIR